MRFLLDTEQGRPAAGVPIVTTPETGSVVRDNVEGRIVPSRDPDALANAITLAVDAGAEFSLLELVKAGILREGLDAVQDVLAVGVFQRRLRFANATKTAECRPFVRGQRFLQLRQHLLPAGKERVAFRKIRKRDF